jgi:hypothetical protein
MVMLTRMGMVGSMWLVCALNSLQKLDIYVHHGRVPRQSLSSLYICDLPKLTPWLLFREIPALGPREETAMPCLPLRSACFSGPVAVVISNVPLLNAKFKWDVFSPHQVARRCCHACNEIKVNKYSVFQLKKRACPKTLRFPDPARPSSPPNLPNLDRTQSSLSSRGLPLFPQKKKKKKKKKKE